MKLKNHINTIFWTTADKSLFVIYGFVYLIQISLLLPDELALFATLINVNTFIFVICDAFALQIIIQYGFDRITEQKANSYALILHILISMVFSLLIFFFGSSFANIFDEKRLIYIANDLPILSLLMIPRTYFAKFLMKYKDIFRLFISDLFFFGTFTIIILYYKFYIGSLNYTQSVEMYFWGTGISSLVTILLASKYVKFGFRGSLPFKKILNFAVPFTLSYGLIAIPRQLDIVILNFFFNLNTIGIYQAARSLFRLFEEGVNAANLLIYPAAVKHYSKGNLNEIRNIVSKGISYILIVFIITSIILLSGMTEFLINLFLKSKYLLSIDYFNMLLIATVFIPFTIYNFILTAANQHYTLLRNIFISVLISILVYIIIGLSQIQILIPLGFITFFAVLAVLNFISVKKSILTDMKFKDLYRAIYDLNSYIRR